jgi:hypothetical protein
VGLSTAGLPDELDVLLAGQVEAKLKGAAPLAWRQQPRRFLPQQLPRSRGVPRCQQPAQPRAQRQQRSIMQRAHCCRRRPLLRQGWIWRWR